MSHSINTRKHSSRMRTARLSIIYHNIPSMGWGGEYPFPRYPFPSRRDMVPEILLQERTWNQRYPPPGEYLPSTSFVGGNNSKLSHTSIGFEFPGLVFSMYWWPSDVGYATATSANSGMRRVPKLSGWRLTLPESISAAKWENEF